MPDAAEYAALAARTAAANPSFGNALRVALDSVAPAAPAAQLPPVTKEIQGQLGTSAFRLQPSKDGRPLSLWHDVPLHERLPSGDLSGNLHFVCEIPKWTRKKFEIATDEAGNPIKQDEKKGELREFKTGAAGLSFNYGCLPQTWEDPAHVHPDAKAGGDNDPLDVCEIGTRQIPSGEVRSVKVLGVLCMIDEGEADWKIIAIDVSDPWAPHLNGVADLEARIPGMVHAIREWFRDYKVADGKPQNKFGLEEQCMDRPYALGIVKECHESWLRLLSGEASRQTTQAAKLNTSHRPSMISLSPEQQARLLQAAAAAVPGLERGLSRQSASTDCHISEESSSSSDGGGGDEAVVSDQQVPGDAPHEA